MRDQNASTELENKGPKLDLGLKNAGPTCRAGKRGTGMQELLSALCIKLIVLLNHAHLFLHERIKRFHCIHILSITRSFQLIQSALAAFSGFS